MDTTDEHLNKARSLMLIEDYNGAIEAYSKVIEIDPEHAGAYYGRGFSFVMTGRKDDACIDFVKAKRLGIAYADEILIRYCNKTDPT